MVVYIKTHVDGYKSEVLGKGMYNLITIKNIDPYDYYSINVFHYILVIYPRYITCLFHIKILCPKICVRIIFLQ